MWKLHNRGALPLALAVLCVIAGCASGPGKNREEVDSPEELIQMGQEAADQNRYKLALEYYEEILTRFPSNIEMVCAAEYEIAFLHYKQKKYGDAKTEFNALLARYTSSGDESVSLQLPLKYRQLSVLMLKRIEEKEQPGKSAP